MPEGDTVYRMAATLDGALAGSVVAGVDGTARAVRMWGRRLRGRSIEQVESIGKHLLVWFEGEFGIRTHLGMPGSWHLYRPGERWRRSPGAARVVIETDEWVAVCFSAPVVAVGRRPVLLSGVGHLGPDLMDDDPDLAEAAARIEGLAGTTPLTDVLLNQRVMAGVGNVVKSEALFLARLHPRMPVADLPGDQRLRLARTAGRLLGENKQGGRRVTTGDRRRGRELWVYNRAGRACRRCGVAIVEADMGTPPRITYWCPQCQPEIGF